MSDVKIRTEKTSVPKPKGRRIAKKLPAELVEWTDGTLTVEHDGEVFDVKIAASHGNDDEGMDVFTIVMWVLGLISLVGVLLGYGYVRGFNMSQLSLFLSCIVTLFCSLQLICIFANIYNNK